MRWMQDERATFLFDDSAPPPDPPDTDLVRSIRKLISSIRVKLEAARSTGELNPRPRSYLVKEVIGVSNKGFTSRQRLEQRVEWDPNIVWDFRMKKIQDTPEFRECKELIERELKGPYPSAFFCALSLVDQAIYALLETVTPERERGLIARFLLDLHRADCNIFITCGIDGVSLEGCEGIRFGVGKIRRVLPADLSTERVWDREPLTASYNEQPTAIVELQSRAKDNTEGSRQMDALLNCLRLFRLGSVKKLWVRTRIESVIHPGMFLDPMSAAGPTEKYTLKAADEEPLRNMVERFYPLLSSTSAQQQMEAVNIAIGRYVDALSMKLILDPRVTLGVTALEALFCRKEEKTEIGYRLSQRVAAMLRTQKLKALEVKKDIKEAYTIRSNYVHGSVTNPTTSRNELCLRVLEYARVCIQICSQLYGTLGKDGLIIRLDNGLLDATAKREFMRHVRTCTIAN